MASPVVHVKSACIIMQVNSCTVYHVTTPGCGYSELVLAAGLI